MSQNLLDLPAGAEANGGRRKETRKRRPTVVDPEGPDSDKSSRRRTVPTALRKRTGRSCDLCKTRRVKCIRPTADADENSLAPCQNCTKLQVPCQSDLPRKTRIYGSVESLSARHRLLTAIVKHLIPDRPTEDNEELTRIVREYGIPIHDLDATESLSSSLPHMRESEILAQPPLPVPLSTSATIPGMASGIVEDETHYASYDAMAPQVHTSSDVLMNEPGDEHTSYESRNAKPAPDERLYPNTQGVMSYLGPSSSFRFMITLRTLLGQIQGQGGISTRESLARDHESLGIQEQGIEEAEAYGDNNPEGETPTTHIAIERASQQVFLDISQADSGANLSPASVNDSVRSGKSLRVQSNGASFFQSTRETLPPREVADLLVEAFFDRVHVNYVIFHRGLFQMQYESLFANPDDLEGDVGHVDSTRSSMDAGWICSIYMVFAFGRQALNDHNPDRIPTLQHNYVGLVQKLLYRVISSTSLSNVQALLLIQLYKHNSGERNTAWVLLGCACRMGISLGMHRNGARGGFSPIIRELRRRVWWTMYTFEKQLSLTLGRPSSIPEDGEVNVGLPNEGMMDGKTYMPPGLLGNMLGLVDILVEIRRSLLLSACSLSANTVLAHPRSTLSRIHWSAAVDTRSILSKLDNWFQQLPSNHSLYWNAEGSNHYRAAHLLHLIYYHARQVITRSYLLRSLEEVLNDKNSTQPSNLSNDVPRTNTDEIEFRNECLAAALSGLQVFDSLCNSDQVDGVAWLDIYWAYHSGIMLLVNLLRERHQSAQSRQDTPLDQQLKDAQFITDSRPVVKRLVTFMQKVKLCKTMQNFANVIVTLTEVVGVDTMHAEETTTNGSGAVSVTVQDFIANTFPASHMHPSQPVVYTDGWLNGWTEGDFLFSMQPDMNIADNFDWI